MSRAPYGRWLRWVGHLVPPERRHEWLAEWQAEVAAGGLTRTRLAQAAGGALPDALWHLSDVWSPDMLRTDLRHALRGLMRQPAFTFLAVLVLALGIGATTAVFSLVDGILLRPLPYHEPERLVALYESNPEKGWVENEAAPANLLDWRERVDAFAAVSASGYAPFVQILGGDEPVTVEARAVFPGFFATLGVLPALGREFTEAELWSESEPPVVLSDALWRRRFAADPGILGRVVDLHGVATTVVGVMPPGFRYLSEVDLWMPFRFERQHRGETWFRRAHFVWPVARLRPGVGLDEAERQLVAVAAQLAEEYPETNRVMGAGLLPLREWIVGDERGALVLLLGAVATMLLVTCANVAGLLLVRAARRGREVAVRSALGAPRWMLARQLLVEGMLLAVAAGLAGVALAHVVLRGLVALAPAELPRLADVAIDGRVLALSLGLTVLATLAFGAWPALAGSRADLRGTLGETPRGGGSRRERRAGRWLVVAEIALAVVLVVGATLAARSLGHLFAVDPGVAVGEVTVAETFVLRSDLLEVNAVRALWRDVEARLAAIPGVRSAAVATRLAFVGEDWTSDYVIAGAGLGREVQHREVSPEFFATAGIPLLAGRPPSAADRRDAPPVVWVSETLARRHFADPAEAVGARITFGNPEAEDATWLDVAGVVGDTRFRGLAAPPGPEAYFPLDQQPSRDVFLLVRGGGPAVAAEIRETLRAVDPRLPLLDLRPLRDAVVGTVARERFTAFILAVFAALGLVLAAVGTYGVLAFAVSRRRREIGVRMAVGATARQVLAEVVREGLLLVAAGWLVGAAATVALWRVLAGFLHGIRPGDPLTYLLSSVLLFAVAILACWVPARRAAGLDPVAVLRRE